MLSDPEADAQQFGGEAESDRRTIEFGVPPPKRLDLAPQCKQLLLVLVDLIGGELVDLLERCLLQCRLQLRQLLELGAIQTYNPDLLPEPG